MFNHGVPSQAAVLICKPKDVKSFHEKVGLCPIVCVTPVLDFMKNEFGFLRNDISLYMSTNDVSLRQSIEKNLDVVLKNSNGDVTVQDAFDAIIPRSVQTPSEIERFGNILADIYGRKFSSNDNLPELSSNSSAVDDSKTDTIEVEKEL